MAYEGMHLGDSGRGSGKAQGSFWEGSGKPLGEALGALTALEAPRVAGKVYLHKVAPLCNGMQKNPFLFILKMFLKVPLTKSAAGQRLRDAGSAPGAPDRPRGLINTTRTLQAKAV